MRRGAELDDFAFYLYTQVLGVQSNDRTWWMTHKSCRAFWRKAARSARAYIASQRAHQDVLDADRQAAEMEADRKAELRPTPKAGPNG